MSKRIKLKDILNENFTRMPMGGMIGGGVVTIKPINSTSLSGIVKEKFGDVVEKVDVKLLTKEISNYNNIGKSIFERSNLKDVAEKLSWMANSVKNHTLQETEDWFDKITVNRNMKELTGLSKSFNKISTEAQTLQERMSGLYEDMGHILGRYYDIDEMGEGSKSYRHGDEDNEDNAKVKEVEGDKAEYQKFFMAALKKFGVKEPDQLPDEKKAEFYNYVDANWKGDNESD